eukprot:TRINITY_DN1541_c0_g1_i1.p1 TRINITY_DN1541_c0_g1~~TRINITY_DN1541_c0_g1_i1.p1  ORF type:complete len:416 (+),score=127.17 TRINITY_DN1541_c0_g1_i1:29-1276(+)
MILDDPFLDIDDINFFQEEDTKITIHNNDDKEMEENIKHFNQQTNIKNNNNVENVENVKVDLKKDDKDTRNFNCAPWIVDILKREYKKILKFQQMIKDTKLQINQYIEEAKKWKEESEMKQKMKMEELYQDFKLNEKKLKEVLENNYAERVHQAKIKGMLELKEKRALKKKERTKSLSYSEIINSSHIIKKPTGNTLRSMLSIKQELDMEISKEYRNALSELTTTEREYLADLKLIEMNYLKPFKMNANMDPKNKKAKRFITERDITNIFANLEHILFIHKQLLEELRQEENLPIKQQNIGFVLLKYCDLFTCYLQYCSNSEIQRQTIERLMKDSPEFIKSLENANQQEVQEGVDLRSLLIKPLQRFCKYPMLLKPMKENAPNDPPKSYDDMQSAYDKFKSVIEKVESMMDEMDL